MLGDFARRGTEANLLMTTHRGRTAKKLMGSPRPSQGNTKDGRGRSILRGMGIQTALADEERNAILRYTTRFCDLLKVR